MWRTGNLGDLIDRNGDPDKTALIDLSGRDGPIEVSHGALDARADAVARALLARGLRRGARVALLAANSADYLAAYLGAMRAGLVAVPVNWRFPEPTIRHVLADSGAAFALVDEERAGAAPAGIPSARLGPGFDDFLDPGPFEAVRPEDGEIAQILYTSGSTGRPKGVPLTHRGHLWAVETRRRLNPDAGRHRFLVAAPLYHMNALAVSKFLLASHAGAVLLPRFAAGDYLRAIERFSCSWLTSVPTMIALVAREDALIDQLDLGSVEVVQMGSAPATTGLFADIRRIFPKARIALGYGTTEAGPCVFRPHPDGLPTPDLSLGAKLDGIGLRLVDGDDRDAEEGELEMLCPANMPGYLNMPERTAEVVAEDGYYRTGDIMRRDRDGFYYFVGRADEMFVVNGENVWPSEVEKVLESHEGIAQACLVGLPDPVRGARPVAFVVAVPGARLDEAAVKAHALAHAPAYMHPREVHFVDALPLSSTTKVDRKALAARALAAGA